MLATALQDHSGASTHLAEHADAGSRRRAEVFQVDCSSIRPDPATEEGLPIQISSAGHLKFGDAVNVWQRGCWYRAMFSCNTDEGLVVMLIGREVLLCQNSLMWNPQ